MSIIKNITDINNLYIGSSPISKVFRGTEQLYLIAPDDYTLITPDIQDALNGGPGTNDFGYSITASDSYIVVGAPKQAGSTGTDSDYRNGAVFVFEPLRGDLVRVIENPNAYSTEKYDHFGYSVDLYGDNLVVGSPYETDPTQTNEIMGTGIVYVFDITDGTLKYTLENPNTGGVDTLDHFGISVAIGSTYIAVGARDDHDVTSTYSESGAVHIFSVATGLLIRTIENPNNYDTPTDDHFGEVMSMSGNYLAVGVTDESSSGGVVSGVAYVFDVTTGATYRTFVNPNIYGTATQDFFGWSVSLYGNNLVVSAPSEDSLQEYTTNVLYSTGVVYVYDISTGNLIHTTTKSSTSDTPLLGRTVHVDDVHYYALEANYNSSSGGSYGSYVHKFLLTDGSFVETYTSPANEYYGWTITTNSTKLILGDPFNTNGNTYSDGRVEVYEK